MVVAVLINLTEKQEIDMFRWMEIYWQKVRDDFNFNINLKEIQMIKEMH